jgi:hypothetical protein
MNKKPFDLQKALTGFPVITGSGLPVTQITLFKDLQESYFSIVGVAGGDYLYAREDGTTGNGFENKWGNLFMVAEKKEVWINIYSKYSAANNAALIQVTQRPHDDQATAKIHRDKLVIAGFAVHDTIPIEIEV